MSPAAASDRDGGPGPDVALVLPAPRPGPPEQDLDYEILLAYLRQESLRAVPVVVHAGDDAESLGSRFAAEGLPRLVYWHLPSRPAFQLVRSLPTVAPGPPTLAGGDFASRHDLAVLARLPALDGIVRGEAEPTLAAVADAVRRGKEWRGEPGLSVRRDSGGVRNPAPPLLEDLDRLPPAADDLVRPDQRDQGRHVLVNRGCDSDCQYCGLQVPYRTEYPGRTRFWRSRSAAAIVDEVEHLHRDFGIDRFFFTAFVFFGYDERGSAVVEQIAREILRRGLQIGFSFVTEAGALYRNRHLLPLLKHAGLRQLTLGIDSGIVRALEMYRVGYGRQEIVGALKALAGEAVPFTTAFIFYDPYLTLDELDQNLRFIRRLAPFYRHLGAPYSYFLDQQILNTVLRVRCEMPICQRLEADGLARVPDPLEGDPQVGFADSRVGRFFRLHQGYNKVVARMIRPFLFHRAVVDEFPHLAQFPLDLLAELSRSLRSEPAGDDDEVMRHLGRWTFSRFAPGWDRMQSLVGAGDADRERFDRFLSGLAGAEAAAASTPAAVG